MAVAGKSGRRRTNEAAGPPKLAELHAEGWAMGVESGSRAGLERGLGGVG